jgi:glyoxalase family protein
MEPLGGLHHVTAITGDAPGNLRFYTQVLGLRLVKKTVNQDDVSAYHLFYADAVATPGTDVTFFDWPWAVPNQPGVPEISPIALRVVDDSALDYWETRLSELEVPNRRWREPQEKGGRLAFEDPEGQRLELVPDGGAPGGEPRMGSEVPVEFQIRGLHGVTLASARPQVTADLLTEVMGFRPVGEREHPEGSREYSFEVGPGGPGTEVRLWLPAEPVRSKQGRGGVHHVAFRVPDEEVHQAWRERVLASGLQATPVIDRFYFKSVYFREPGGNLFEIATDGPGFTADEPLAELGKHLALPPFLEPERERIEAGLNPLPT